VASLDTNNSSPTYGQFLKYDGVDYSFAGGASQIARDGMTVLIGDNLIPSSNGSIMTLAFVIGLVACWSSLILVEQVMYSAEKQQRWWPWALACALVQGGPGVWALHMIAMCSYSWPAPVGLTFNPSWASGSLVMTVIINLLAFYAGLYGWQSNKAFQERTSSHGSTASRAGGSIGSGGTATTATATVVGSDGSPYTIVRRVNVQHNDNNENKHKDNPTTTNNNNDVAAHPKNLGDVKRSHSKDNNNNNGNSVPTRKRVVTKNTRRRRKITRLTYDRTIVGQLKLLPLRVNIWFCLSAMLLSATTMLSHWTIGLSLPSAYGARAGNVPIILFFVFGSVLFLWAILMCFYFFPTAGVRFMGNSPPHTHAISSMW
jgi:hypothetical protein